MAVSEHRGNDTITESEVRDDYAGVDTKTIVTSKRLDGALRVDQVVNEADHQTVKTSLSSTRRNEMNDVVKDVRSSADRERDVRSSTGNDTFNLLS